MQRGHLFSCLDSAVDLPQFGLFLFPHCPQIEAVVNCKWRTLLGRISTLGISQVHSGSCSLARKANSILSQLFG